jgi:hypothetical protein
MKNITSYLLVVVFSLLGFQTANANGPSRQSGRPSGATKPGVGSYKAIVGAVVASAEALKGADACNAADLPFKFNDMKFLGKPLKELIPRWNECFVVKFKQQAVQDSMGSAACKNFGGDTALNPGNEQYIGKQQNRTTGNTRSNVLGYYFCIPLDKQGMCEARMADPSINTKMTIDWVEHERFGSANKRNSGDCKCRPLGAQESAAVNCPFNPEDVQVTGCVDTKSKMDPVTKKCMCTANKEMESKGPNFCQDPETVVTATVDDNDLNLCLNDIKAANDSCSSKGQAAFDKCSKEAPEVNKNIEEAQRVMGIGVDVLVAKNAGTGALEACGKMSLAGNGALSLLGLLRKNCKDELTSCKQGCADVKAYSERNVEEMTNECRDKLLAEQKPWTGLHAKRFRELAEVYQNNASNAEKFCTADVEFADTQLDDMMNALEKSVAAANVCKCQLTTSSNGTSCDELTSPLTCLQNANQPGCSFNSVGCAPGSTAANCKGGVVAVNGGGSGVSGFAGFNGTGFSSAAGPAAGKVNVGDSDMSFYDETRPLASGTTATADAGSPFGSAGSAGVGQASGGGGGDSGSKAGGGGGDGSEKGGLSGLFQSAKSGIASMFGGGSNGSGATGKKDNKNFKNDVNGFRPKSPAVRGMANASEFNGKNTDIWKRMNKQYDDQHHTFITVENPTK